MAIKPEHRLLQRPLYAFDLPESIADSLEYKPRSSASPEGVSTDPPPNNDAASPALDSSPSSTATSCALCALNFDNVVEQRRHHRSDLHSYNIKRKLKGLKAVTEAEFEKLIGDLDESLSGSDSSDDSSDGENKSAVARQDTTLSALLKKQARLNGDGPEDNSSSTNKHQRQAIGDPIIWFTSPLLPSNVSLGFYRAVFDRDDQIGDARGLVRAVQRMQLKAQAQPIEPRSTAGQDGGVPLPAPMITNTSAAGPHYFLCMMGGGHFAAMIVSLTPKIARENERSATVLAHKTFHRYTTRRKQGGAQSANDSAKGAAHSAGSSLRRYNETALTAEIRELLSEWKHWIESSGRLFIRATGSANRRTLYGPYDGQILRANDERIRGFPFNTRRATQAELMRAFIELTRVKVHVIDEEAEARRAEEARIAAEEAATRSASIPVFQ